MQKITAVEVVNNYMPDKPNGFTALIFWLICKFFCIFRGVKKHYDFDPRKLNKKQIVLLSDHSCREQYYYTYGCYPFKKMNPVVSYQNFFKKSLHKGLFRLGAIPKQLYVADYKSTKTMLNLKNNGASLLIYPEGIQSVSGVNEPINPATFGFIKHLGLDVVLCSSKGAFLTNTRYSREMKKGKVEVTYKHLFTPEDLEKMSVDEIREKFTNEFRYNDFIWNEKEQNSYKGKHSTAYRIEHLLYRCPKCGKEFEMSVNGNELICGSCGNTIIIDDKYNISPKEGSVLPYKRIDNWYFSQREEVKKEISKPNFLMESSCELLRINKENFSKNQFLKIGEGKVSLDKNGLHYNGTNQAEYFQLDIPIVSMPSLSYARGEEIELYFDNEYYSFRLLDKPTSILKFSIAVQEMHCKIDDSWKKAWDDVKHIN